MKTLMKLIAVLLLLTACSKQENPNEIIIEGLIRNIPDGKVFLCYAYDPREIVDSTVAENGHFKFVIERDSSFVPFLASIYHRDSTLTEHNYIRRIAFLNTYQSKGKAKSVTFSFFQGRENTTIKESLDIPEDPRIPTFHYVDAGKENVLYQKFMNKGFGNLGSSDSTKRLARIAYFERVVKQNSDSDFLLHEIYQNKEAYTEKELRSLLSFFDEDKMALGLGQEFSIYLANRPAPNKPYPNLLLTNAENEKSNILHPEAQVNLLVFWASWCKPCRQEIPALKELNGAFKDEGLNMVSISIDENRDYWHKAMAKENMPWQQFIVGKEQMKEVKQQFNFTAIPFVVLTDNAGKEIMKVLGYSESNVATIKMAIAKHLANN